MAAFGVLLRLFSLFSCPFIVLGCSCLLNPFSLTDIRSACSDYRYSDDVYAAKVVDSDWCRCFDHSCSENHTAEVVEVFKGKYQVQLRSYQLHALIAMKVAYIPAEIHHTSTCVISTCVKVFIVASQLYKVLAILLATATQG